MRWLLFRVMRKSAGADALRCFCAEPFVRPIAFAMGGSGWNRRHEPRPPYESLPFEDLTALTDEHLIERLASGLQEALAVLFDRYRRLVFDVAFRIVRDACEAEQVVQTVFLDMGS